MVAFDARLVVASPRLLTEQTLAELPPGTDNSHQVHLSPPSPIPLMRLRHDAANIGYSAFWIELYPLVPQSPVP